MELSDYLTQPHHDWQALLATTYRVASGCHVQVTRLSASALPSGQSASTSASPPVTTHFFTLVREHFQVEAKLASTHLSQFQPWTHSASPSGSQQIVHGAHVLGEEMRMRMRMRDEGRRGGVKLYTPLTSHILILRPPPQVTAICATVDDNATLSGVLGLTSCLTLLHIFRQLLCHISTTPMFYTKKPRSLAISIESSVWSLSRVDFLTHDSN